jgi:hypothetical protein
MGLIGCASSPTFDWEYRLFVRGGCGDWRICTNQTTVDKTCLAMRVCGFAAFHFCGNGWEKPRVWEMTPCRAISWDLGLMPIDTRYKEGFILIGNYPPHVER